MPLHRVRRGRAASARRAVALLGAVALSGGGLIAAAKDAEGVTVVSVSGENRDRLPAELAARYAKLR